MLGCVSRSCRRAPPALRAGSPADGDRLPGAFRSFYVHLQAVGEAGAGWRGEGERLAGCLAVCSAFRRPGAPPERLQERSRACGRHHPPQGPPRREKLPRPAGTSHATMPFVLRRGDTPVPRPPNCNPHPLPSAHYNPHTALQRSRVPSHNGGQTEALRAHLQQHRRFCRGELPLALESARSKRRPLAHPPNRACSPAHWRLASLQMAQNAAPGATGVRQAGRHRRGGGAGATARATAEGQGR